jgi:peptidyl-tRNA hydrolase, PTH1 family
MLRRSPNPERLVIGLGNPGRDYARSRHNAGFLVVDALARKHGLRFAHRWAQAQVAVGDLNGMTVALAKPQTYMNLSGESARSLLRRLSLSAGALFVVTDDIDMSLGRIRLRERGSSGGHRGVQSIVDRLGTDEFVRLKIGVGRPDPREAADYVLAEFTPAEREAVAEIVGRAVEAIEAALSDGVAAAMNRYNG